MEKRLIDYLHYYIGHKVKWYIDKGTGFKEGALRTLTAELLGEHVSSPTKTYIELYLKPTAEITREHARLFIEYTPDEFGDTVHWYIKRGYDVFGLIKAGLAKHKHTLYE